MSSIRFMHQFVQITIWCCVSAEEKRFKCNIKLHIYLLGGGGVFAYIPFFFFFVQQQQKYMTNGLCNEMKGK